MQEKIIGWKDVYGNKFRWSLHPHMLSSKGYKVKTVTKIRGESKKTPCAVTIVFDKTYVIAYLSAIVEKLSPENYIQLGVLMKQSYDHWKQGKEKEVL